MKILLLAAVGLSLSGCAALIPNTVTPEIEHMSHMTQHEPFTSDPTNVGVEIANVVVGWELPHNFKVDIAEGVTFHSQKAPYNDKLDSYGEIIGPREQFSLRIGYTFHVKQ